MSTQTWKPALHPRNTNGAGSGNTGAFATKQLQADDSIVLTTGSDPWGDHGNAMAYAADAIGVSSGAAYGYNSTSMLVNPNGQAEANLNLSDAGGNLQLRHNYATGMTTLNRGKNSISDPDQVNAVVRDIYGVTRASSDLFHSLREKAMESGIHPSVHTALQTDSRNRPDGEAHHRAVEDAVFNAGVYHGHAYEVKGTSVLLNPWKEPEAAIHLDDGSDTYLIHNYATGRTSYTCEALGIKDDTDAELIRIAVDDITSEKHTAETLFETMKTNMLGHPSLHPALRAGLENPVAVDESVKAARARRRSV